MSSVIDPASPTGAACALILAAGMAVTAFAVAWHVCGARDTLTRWVTMVGAAAVLLTAAFHLLTAFNAFTRGPALVVVAILGAASWFATRRALPARWRRERVFARRIARLLRRSPNAGLAIPLAAFFVPPMLRALVLPPLGWDTLVSHSTKAAMWVQHGRIAGMDGPGSWAYYQSQLGGFEALEAWAMLPTHTDLFVPFLDLIGWLGFGLAIVAFARAAGAREPYASTAAAFVLAVPTVRMLVGSAYVEFWSMTTLFAAGAIGLARGGTAPAAIVVVAALLGVAAATKLQMIPITIVALLVLGARWYARGGPKRTALQRDARWNARGGGPDSAALQRHDRDERRWIWLAGAVAAYGAMLLPWLLRTWAETGAPFSPYPIRLGPVALGTPPPEVEWMLDRGSTPAAGIELDVLRRVFAIGEWPQTHVLGLFAIVPLVVGALAIPRLARRSPWAGVLVVVLSLVSLGIYSSKDFWVVRHDGTISSCRFLVPALTLAAIASVSWCRTGSRSATLYRHLLALLTLANLALFLPMGVGWASIRAAILLAVAVLAFGVVGLAASRGRTKAIRRTVAVACMVAALLALDRIRDRYRHTFFATEYDFQAVAMYWAPAVPRADIIDRHERIAVTAGPAQFLDNWFAYPFFGRRLQNELLYVPVSRDGHVRHMGRREVNDELVATADFEAWRTRLREQGVTQVMSFLPPSIELAWMEQRPQQFARLAGERGRWGLFAVAGAGRQDY